eukprot:COSAG02_NODE_457_length_21950_cov_35.452794_9_plen_68_part_00
MIIRIIAKFNTCTVCRGNSVEHIYADPDYQVESPDYEEVLIDLCETPTNIWCAVLLETIGILSVAFP